MIEFNILQQDDARQVMKEFRPLVEKSGVVLIAFNNEVRTIRNLEALSKVFRDAADKKGRLPTRDFEDPCKHRSRRRLSVRAGDHNRILTAYEQLLNRFRHR